MSAFEHAQHPRAGDGTFRTGSRAESVVDLVSAPPGPAVSPGRRVEEDTGDENDTRWSQPGTGNEAFNRSVRALLGVSDQRRKVHVTMAGGEVNPWGCDTWESWTEIAVSCGDKSKEYEDLPELLRALELANAAPVTTEQVEAMIGQHAVVWFPGGIRIEARVANANSWQALFITAERVRVPGSDNDWHKNKHGEHELRIGLPRILSIEIPNPLDARGLARDEHDRLVAQLPEVFETLFDDESPARQDKLTSLYTDRVETLAQFLGALNV